MPPKKKAKIVAGQKRLVLNKDSVTLEDLGSDASSSVCRSSDSARKRGEVESWQRFGEEI